MLILLLLRKYLQNGKLHKVNKLLDRKWSIDGKVQKGRQLGKKIGFPTANIDIKDYVSKTRCLCCQS